MLVATVFIAATLESVFAYCLGCQAFALLMRAGVVPAQICEACANVSLRTADTAHRGGCGTLIG